MLASMVGCRATPAEIGRLRKEIREAVRHDREQGVVLANVFVKAATLDESSWIWLCQRMRPAERDLLRQMTGREPY
jgi:hypothetical protein